MIRHKSMFILFAIIAALCLGTPSEAGINYGGSSAAAVSSSAASSGENYDGSNAAAASSSAASSGGNSDGNRAAASSSSAATSGRNDGGNNAGGNGDCIWCNDDGSKQFMDCVFQKMTDDPKFKKYTSSKRLLEKIKTMLLGIAKSIKNKETKDDIMKGAMEFAVADLMGTNENPDETISIFTQQCKTAIKKSPQAPQKSKNIPVAGDNQGNNQWNPIWSDGPQNGPQKPQNIPAAGDNQGTNQWNPTWSDGPQNGLQNGPQKPENIPGDGGNQGRKQWNPTWQQQPQNNFQPNPNQGGENGFAYGSANSYTSQNQPSQQWKPLPNNANGWNSPQNQSPNMFNPYNPQGNSNRYPNYPLNNGESNTGANAGAFSYEYRQQNNRGNNTPYPGSPGRNGGGSSAAASSSSAASSGTNNDGSSAAAASSNAASSGTNYDYYDGNSAAAASSSAASSGTNYDYYDGNSAAAASSSSASSGGNYDYYNGNSAAAASSSSSSSGRNYDGSSAAASSSSATSSGRNDGGSNAAASSSASSSTYNLSQQPSLYGNNKKDKRKKPFKADKMQQSDPKQQNMPSTEYDKAKKAMIFSQTLYILLVKDKNFQIIFHPYTTKEEFKTLLPYMLYFGFRSCGYDEKTTQKLVDSSSPFIQGFPVPSSTSSYAEGMCQMLAKLLVQFDMIGDDPQPQATNLGIAILAPLKKVISPALDDNDALPISQQNLSDNPTKTNDAAYPQVNSNKQPNQQPFDIYSGPDYSVPQTPVQKWQKPHKFYDSNDQPTGDKPISYDKPGNTKADQSYPDTGDQTRYGSYDNYNPIGQWPNKKWKKQPDTNDNSNQPTDDKPISYDEPIYNKPNKKGDQSNGDSQYEDYGSSAAASSSSAASSGNNDGGSNAAAASSSVASSDRNDGGSNAAADSSSAASSGKNNGYYDDYGDYFYYGDDYGDDDEEECDDYPATNRDINPNDYLGLPKKKPEYKIPEDKTKQQPDDQKNYSNNNKQADNNYPYFYNFPGDDSKTIPKWKEIGQQKNKPIPQGWPDYNKDKIQNPSQKSPPSIPDDQQKTSDTGDFWKMPDSQTDLTTDAPIFPPNVSDNSQNLDLKKGKNDDSKERVEILMKWASDCNKEGKFDYKTYSSVIAALVKSCQQKNPDKGLKEVQIKVLIETIYAVTQMYVKSTKNDQPQEVDTPVPSSPSQSQQNNPNVPQNNQNPNYQNGQANPQPVVQDKPPVDYSASKQNIVYPSQNRGIQQTKWVNNQNPQLLIQDKPPVDNSAPNQNIVYPSQNQWGNNQNSQPVIQDKPAVDYSAPKQNIEYPSQNQGIQQNQWGMNQNSGPANQNTPVSQPQSLNKWTNNLPQINIPDINTPRNSLPNGQQSSWSFAESSASASSVGPGNQGLTGVQGNWPPPIPNALNNPNLTPNGFQGLTGDQSNRNPAMQNVPSNSDLGQNEFQGSIPASNGQDNPSPLKNGNQANWPDSPQNNIMPLGNQGNWPNSQPNNFIPPGNQGNWPNSQPNNFMAPGNQANWPNSQPNNIMGAGNQGNLPGLGQNNFMGPGNQGMGGMNQAGNFPPMNQQTWG